MCECINVRTTCLYSPCFTYYSSIHWKKKSYLEDYKYKKLLSLENFSSIVNFFFRTFVPKTYFELVYITNYAIHDVFQLNFNIVII